MESGTHGVNGTEIIPEVAAEITESSEWPEAGCSKQS